MHFQPLLVTGATGRGARLAASWRREKAGPALRDPGGYEVGSWGMIQSNLLARWR
jgi:hypothetical protein